MTKITKALPEEFESVIEIANRVFAPNDDNYFKTFHPVLYDGCLNTAKYHYVVKEEDKIVAEVGLFPAVVNIMGEKIMLGGAGTMCVDKACRGKGYMKDLMNTLVEGVKTDGYHLAWLGGRRQRYEYFGFTPAGTQTSFNFVDDNGKHTFGVDSEPVYTFCDPSPDDIAFAEKSNALYSRRKAYFERTSEDFYKSLCNCALKPIQVKYKNGETAGYLQVAHNGTCIREFELEDNSDICRMLYDYLREMHIDGVTCSHIFAFETEKLNALASICEWYNTANTESFYIEDYKTVIKAFGNLKASYRPMCDGEMTVEVENSCKIKISVCSGKVETADYEGEADIKLSQLEATSIMFGGGYATYKKAGTLPAFAMTLFPLPLFFAVPDHV